MGMTITEKIMARAAGEGKVLPGELIDAKLDVVLFIDVTGPAQYKILLQARSSRRMSRAAAGTGPYSARRSHHRAGFAHLHVRGVRSL